ncbi:MAG: nucleotidyltransferase domain-containing protein [Candidatus Woesearchaeota archaeon]
MKHIDIAREFGKYCYSKKNDYDIIDIVLFGSVAKKHLNPKDIDIMLIHENPVFEKLQNLHGKDYFSNDIQRFHLIDKMLQDHNYPSIKEVMKNNVIAEAISKNILNLRYLNKNFFHDKIYYEEEILRNIDPKFFDNIFEYALLWNPNTENYDIPIKNKYKLLK